MLHDVAGTRPTTPDVLAHDAAAVGVLYFDRVESLLSCRRDDGPAHSAIELIVAFKELMAGGELVVDVFKKLGATGVASPIGKNSVIVGLEHVPEEHHVLVGCPEQSGQLR